MFFGGCKAERLRMSLFLVFEGTSHPKDVLQDLTILPQQHGALCLHGGFLAGVKDNAELNDALSRHVTGAVPLYVFGHSLGGALAHVVVHANSLPASHVGPVLACGFGAPCVLHGDLGLQDTRNPRVHVMNVVNNSDVVPRLLGSKMNLVKGVVDMLRAGDGGRVRDRRGAAIAERALQAAEGYVHSRATQIYYLKDDEVFDMPHDARKLLHLHESASTRAVADHGIDQYERILRSVGARRIVSEAEGAPARKRARRGRSPPLVDAFRRLSVARRSEL